MNNFIELTYIGDGATDTTWEYTKSWFNIDNIICFDAMRVLFSDGTCIPSNIGNNYNVLLTHLNLYYGLNARLVQ